MFTRTYRIGIDGRYLCDRYPGVGRYTFELLRALGEVAQGVELIVFHDPSLPNSRFPVASLSGPGLRLERTSVPVRTLGEQLAMRRAVRRLGLDLFHSPFFFGPLQLPCRRAVTVHDLIPVLFPASVPSRLRRATLPLAIRAMAGSAALILTPSQATRQDWLRWRPETAGSVVVVPEAPGADLRPPPAHDVAEARVRLGLGGPYVLFLGSHRPHKNLVRLVEAWTRMGREGRRDRTLVLAGPQDPRFPEARLRCEELGLEDVRFPGPVAEEDLAALYAGADLFVLPSLSEGFGLPVLEAMACGTAVACSRAGAVPEVAGDAAAYFDPTRVAPIAAALSALLSSPARRRELAAAGRRRAATFSWAVAARKTLAAYRELLDGEG